MYLTKTLNFITSGGLQKTGTAMPAKKDDMYGDTISGIQDAGRVLHPHQL
jgi:hypothetical protein